MSTPNKEPIYTQATGPGQPGYRDRGDAPPAGLDPVKVFQSVVHTYAEQGLLSYDRMLAILWAAWAAADPAAMRAAVAQLAADLAAVRPRRRRGQAAVTDNKDYASSAGEAPDA